MYKMCPGRIMKSILLKLTATISSKIDKGYIACKTDHQILHSLFCLQFSVALETVNPKNLCLDCFQKVNTQLKCFFA